MRDAESYERAAELERLGLQIIDLPRTGWRGIAVAKDAPLFTAYGEEAATCGSSDGREAGYSRHSRTAALTRRTSAHGAPGGGSPGRASLHCLTR